MGRRGWLFRTVRKWLEWLRPTVRRKLHWFPLVFIAEGVIYLVLLWYYNINISKTFLGFAGFILSTVILWHNLLHKPAICLTGFNVTPYDKYGNVNCTDSYRNWTYSCGRLMPSVRLSRCNNDPRRVDCKSEIAKFRISNDVTNLGYRSVQVHDYSFERTWSEEESKKEPEKECKVIVTLRKSLRYQRRVTVCFEYPNDRLNEPKLSSSAYGWKLFVSAANQECERRIWVKVTEDRKTCIGQRRREKYEDCSVPSNLCQTRLSSVCEHRLQKYLVDSMG